MTSQSRPFISCPVCGADHSMLHHDIRASLLYSCQRCTHEWLIAPAVTPPPAGASESGENDVSTAEADGESGRILPVLLRIAAAGAVAGAVNAWLCYARWPVPVEEYSDFSWHLVPAGAVHGAVLGLSSFLGSRWLRGVGWAKRLMIATATGWIAGYLSWQPLRMSLEERLGWSTWPFDGPMSAWFIGPLQIFGLVTCLYCLVPPRWTPGPRAGASSLIVASLAGAVGSLWWWLSVGPWHFSLLHGAIWGCAVGLAWWSLAAAPASARGSTITYRPPAPTPAG